MSIALCSGVGCEGPSVSTCELFTDGPSVIACCGQAARDLAYADPDGFDLVIQAASDYVSELLARQFRGVCCTTTHACPPCSCGGGPVFGPAPGWMGWGWTWGGASQCRCGPYPSIDLGIDPVVCVDQITFEGVALDPASYRVDAWRWLVRLDDPATGENPGWPRPNRRTARPGGTGELLVVYRHGIPAPPLAQLAARDVACQLIRACDLDDDECSLPANVTQLVRAGTTISLTSLAEALRRGEPTLGILTLQAAVDAYNPHGWRSPAVVDDPQPSRFA